jgi:mannose-6-phosphate isomerase-like protein (cupin superfamily)
MKNARTEATRPVVVAADDGERLAFAGVTGLLKIDGDDTDGRFAAASFPHIAPHVLAAPLHRHHNEDEYTCVLDGRLDVQLGELVVTAHPGMWVIKRRGQWHTFWNAGDTPCRTIEIVSPSGFQRYFREAAAIGGDLEGLARLNAAYSIDMQLDSLPQLCARYGLTFPAG